MAQRMMHLVPLAGDGQAFLDAGFAAPKPLIPVADEPMVVGAIKSLPQADEYVFLCKSNQLKVTTLQSTLKKHFQPMTIVPVEATTDGPAATCLLARDLLEKEDAHLTISPCDHFMTYDLKAFKKLLRIKDLDAIVWTFRGNPIVLQGPDVYSWAELDDNHELKSLTYKSTPTDNPLNQHALTGTLTFKNPKRFLEVLDVLAKRKEPEAEHLSLDAAVYTALQMGLKLFAFDVDHFICMRSPEDLSIYNYWDSFFKQFRRN